MQPGRVMGAQTMRVWQKYDGTNSKCLSYSLYIFAFKNFQKLTQFVFICPRTLGIWKKKTRTHIQAIFTPPVNSFARSDSSPVFLLWNSSITCSMLPFLASVALNTFLAWSDRLLTAYATILGWHNFESWKQNLNGNLLETMFVYSRHCGSEYLPNVLHPFYTVFFFQK